MTGAHVGTQKKGPGDASREKKNMSRANLSGPYRCAVLPFAVFVHVTFTLVTVNPSVWSLCLDSEVEVPSQRPLQLEPSSVAPLFAF